MTEPRGYLAVDPGISGALAIVNSQGRCIDYLLMPTIKLGTKNRVNGAAIRAWLDQWPGLSHAYLEKVQARPAEGPAGAFSFGHSAGLVEGIITGAGIPLTMVTPQSWKKHHKLIGTEKDAARSRAVQLFPDQRVLDLKGKGQALADALLIGLYGISTQPISQVA